MAEQHEFGRQADNVRNAMRHFQKGLQVLAAGPADYYFDRIAEQLDMLFRRFSPFLPGSRVALKNTPDIKAGSGWTGSSHFLKAGARGTVESVETRGDQFEANVVFDEESWIDQQGQCQSVETKHTYNFLEGELNVLVRQPRSLSSELE